MVRLKTHYSKDGKTNEGKRMDTEGKYGTHDGSKIKTLCGEHSHFLVYYTREKRRVTCKKCLRKLDGV